MRTTTITAFRNINSCRRQAPPEPPHITLRNEGELIISRDIVALCNAENQSLKDKLRGPLAKLYLVDICYSISG
ncbi:hypothetical protein Leryth_024710 [Lithospermum erythrorhizon]|nr:hypothetical protein Leryth_024710 [Lithospermum erythrorhizon]